MSIHMSGTVEVGVASLFSGDNVPSEVTAQMLADKLSQMGSKRSILEDLDAAQFLDVWIEYPNQGQEDTSLCPVIWEHWSTDAFP